MCKSHKQKVADRKAKRRSLRGWKGGLLGAARKTFGPSPLEGIVSAETVDVEVHATPRPTGLDDFLDAIAFALATFPDRAVLRHRPPQPTPDEAGDTE